MTRQDTVVKICKLTRITGEIKRMIDVFGHVDFASFVPDLLYIDEWADDVCQYVKTDHSTQLSHLISDMGRYNCIEAYVQSHRETIKTRILMYSTIILKRGVNWSYYVNRTA